MKLLQQWYEGSPVWMGEYAFHDVGDIWGQCRYKCLHKCSHKTEDMNYRFATHCTRCGSKLPTFHGPLGEMRNGFILLDNIERNSAKMDMYSNPPALEVLCGECMNAEASAAKTEQVLDPNRLTEKT